MRRGSGAKSNPVVRTIDVGAGVALSPYLVGMHIHRWPRGKPLSPAPTYGFGTARSLNYVSNDADYRIFAWPNKHPAAGVYNFEPFDHWVDLHHAAGRRIIYSFLITPPWLRTSESIVPGWGGDLGGASVPQGEASGFPEAQAYIKALISRYNDGTELGRKIWGIEVWNEPHFGGVGSGSWEGTPGQLVALVDAIGAAIAASSDTGVKLLGCGFDGSFDVGGPLDAFLAAEHSQSPGTYGRDVIASRNVEITVHFYKYGYLRYWDQQTESAIAAVKATLASHSLSATPWHVSEEGLDIVIPVGTGSWPVMTDAQRGAFNARHVVLQGLLGVQSVGLYSHDKALSGDFTQPALADAIHRVHTEIAGKTITSAQFRFDGSLELIADGNYVRI